MESGNRWWTWAALGLLALTACVPLGAPLFPTQDGPVHLYYVDLLRGLLSHSPPYAQHFQIKSLLTPYALEYYALLVLEFFFPPLLSERLLVAIYVFAFGLGFRYLVEAVAERGSPWILAGIPFCLNMLVYMGFLNYCLALAMLLAEGGLWIRYASGVHRGWVPRPAAEPPGSALPELGVPHGRDRRGRRGSLGMKRAAALLAVLILMLLTHPVPVAVFLTFAAVHLMMDAVHDLAAGGVWSNWLRARRPAIVLIAMMAAISLAWVSFFLDVRGATDRNFVAKFGWFDAVATELQLYHVAPFSGLRYRAALIALLAFAGAALVAGLRRNRKSVSPATAALLVSSWGCFLLFCVVPERVNGGFYFAERFPIVWVLFLLAGASGFRLPRAWSVAAGGLAAAVTLVILLQQRAVVSEISSRIAPIETVPPVKAGSVGLIVGHRSVPPGLQFNPFLWSGVHYFRRSQAILANDPWMNVSLIMMRPADPSRWSFLDPNDAGRTLISGADRKPAGENLDFVVQVGPRDFALADWLRRAGWSEAATDRLVYLYRRP